MDRQFKIYAMIGDIHIGKKSVSPDRLKQQLLDYHITPLKNMKHLDGIFVLGDILDTIISNNSEYSEVYNWLSYQWYKVSKDRKCPCIIIKGTKSHDNDQLNNIKHYQNNNDDVQFRIYDTIEEITIHGKRILILPDIKISDEKAMDRLFSKENRFDMILGHGLISTMKFVVQESENMPMKTYVYDLKKLITSCKGPIIFGHIHTHTNYKNKFYYTGSFDKLERGSTGNNGFLITGIYDKDTSKFKVEQYINPEAASYINIKLTPTDISDNDIIEVFDYIDLCLEDSKATDLITINIERNDDLTSSDKVLMIDNRYREDKRISIKRTIRNLNKDKEEKDINEKRERYSYILDEGLEVSEIMYRFYSEDIKDTLSSPVTLVLDDFIRALN